MVTSHPYRIEKAGYTSIHSRFTCNLHLGPYTAITSTSITVQPDRDAVCITCMFSASSTSLGCAVLLHPVHFFSNVTVREIGYNTAQPYCIPVQDEGNFSVAIFEWKSDGFVGFKPVSVSEVYVSKEEPIKGENNNYTEVRKC